jgi:hypothetical protein
VSLRHTFGAIVIATLVLGVVGYGQAVPQERPQLAEQVFKNVQVLRGIPVKEFMGTMGMFSASLGLNCTDCHVEEAGGDWSRYADETELKRTSRRMMAMVTSLNKSMFGGRQAVSCFSCHRGINRPRVIPDLTVQYGDAIIIEPDEILAQDPAEPTPDEVFDQYLAAIGGAQRAASLTSYTAKGTYQGFDDFDKYPVEIYATAPGRRATIMHGAFGDSMWIFDGRNGWVRQPRVTAPVPVVPLTSGDLGGAKVEAEVAFPARIQQMLTEWRVGLPAIVNDRELRVVQGKLAAGGLPIKLYFDPMTKLLVRLVYFNDTPVGRIPTQIDYEDYRDVAGLKMPFKWTTTWTDGRSVIELTSVEPNVPIEARRFAKPDPPA